MNPQDIKKLHQFITNNSEMEELESLINEFNPFKILKVDNYEIRHSNVLSWLLNPRENHNLKEDFLKKFICDSIINNDNIDIKYTSFDIQLANLNNVEIRREWRNIDILILSEELKICLLIENKIYSTESGNQLEKYLQIVKDTFKEYEYIPIYLTLKDEDPTCEEYGKSNYASILKILKTIIKMQRENLNPKVLDFIQYYSKNLELLTMEDEQVKDLCKKIYKEHKFAIDLINQYSSSSQFETAAQEFMNEKHFKYKGNNSRDAWFIPDEICTNIQAKYSSEWGWGFPIQMWFSTNTDKHKIKIILEIGPIGNADSRQKLLKLFEKRSIKIKKTSYKEDAKYTRIYTQQSEISDWDDKEELINKMGELFELTRKIRETTQEVLIEFKKSEV